ncbi:membrane protein YqaA with SNARE-associated domain [Actinoplanes lutulentus]|uniref:Membrane protein YqaA with SNARE-associated domain n=1 Tax=Actinoplanes lutulentus TaxID=1287878 RepID=A0A327Z3Y4_9ACTN|nr:hypothetical protein [Actinoplanes lutulentus]MBB2947744.1 membrane protein YqaA with SNARE-associated domain [Actinoplanes lutulentus]RAK29942.1 hypothetical protein B0I29_117268 [Actinoplanes lutulentus]
MIAVLTAVAVGFLSAFLPFTPAEPYVITAVLTTEAPPVALGLAAAAGQTAGKVLIFLAARGALRSAWLRQRLDRHPPTPPGPPDAAPTPPGRPDAVPSPPGLPDAVPTSPGRLGTLLARPKAAGARLIEVMDRPRQATGMLLLSAITGFPPLLAASVYLGRTPMRPAVFAAMCMLGRAIRFVAIALAGS